MVLIYLNSHMNKIEHSKSTCELIEPRVIEVIVKDNASLEVDDIIEIREANQVLAKGGKYVVLLESGFNTSLSKEAREESSKKEYGETRKAMAFVINSLSQRIVGNFFIQMNKPPTPTKIFTSKKEALTWAKSHLKL